MKYLAGALRKSQGGKQRRLRKRHRTREDKVVMTTKCHRDPGWDQEREKTTVKKLVESEESLEFSQY